MKPHLISAALLAATALPVSAQDTGLDMVVATVNGTDITMTHVIDVQRQLPEQYRSLDAEVLFESIVDQLVQQRVLAESVENEPEWVEATLETTRASILAQVALEALGEVAVSEEAVRAAYDEQFGEFEGASEFNASHILVETEEEAQSLIEQLEGGADFAALAQEFSTGPSGPNGGQLGWFGQGMMVPSFEAAVMELEVGGVSAPVQTQFGWHIVTLNDLRTTEPPSFEEVQGDLTSQLQTVALEAALTGLLEVAEITRPEGIDPNLINELTLDSE
ncbi:MAG: peptidylprolyl isomerase [Rhodobacteraceae bacterium]|nr:peptidylprolyl isomerase [Paracoccaceae bacterium]